MASDPTRRDFIVRTTLGAIALARGSEARAMEEAQGDWLPLLVGTYTEGGRSRGVYATRLNGRTGELAAAEGRAVGENPSFLALHPNGRRLYAVNEVERIGDEATGAVAAFDLARWKGSRPDLPLVGTRRPTGGGAPCYAALDRDARFLLVANYVGGNVAVFPVEADGALGAAAHVVQHQGAGKDAERQAAAHAHCVRTDPSNRFALVADLGVDRVMSYRLGADGRLARVEGGEAATRPGAGPRHLEFHPTLPLVFVANELDSTVTTLRLDAETGRLSAAGEPVSTLPAGWEGKSFVADIHLGPRGDALYVSNRGHDSIAVFSVDPATGALARTQTVPTEGHWPRNFALSPSGRWLVVANQRSNSLVVLARDPDTGRLSSTGRRLDVPAPVCVLFRGDSA